MKPHERMKTVHGVGKAAGPGEDPGRHWPEGDRKRVLDKRWKREVREVGRRHEAHVCIQKGSDTQAEPGGPGGLPRSVLWTWS